VSAQSSNASAGCRTMRNEPSLPLRSSDRIRIEVTLLCTTLVRRAPALRKVLHEQLIAAKVGP
jgi:hypothetical protein